ncbi:hypothetical protein SALCHL_000147 [Streptomyces albus subsp. chlorinus]|nr:hypothetical protein [Streptomyces albus]
MRVRASPFATYIPPAPGGRNGNQVAFFAGDEEGAETPSRGC